MRLCQTRDYRNKVGIVDLENNALVVPCEFDDILIGDLNLRLKLGSKWAIIPIKELYKIVYKLSDNF